MSMCMSAWVCTGSLLLLKWDEQIAAEATRSHGAIRCHNMLATNDGRKISIRCFWFPSLNPFENFPLHEHFASFKKCVFFFVRRFSTPKENRKAMNEKKEIKIRQYCWKYLILYLFFSFFLSFSHRRHCFVVDFNFTHSKSQLASIREKLWQVLLEIECLDIVCLAIRWIWQVERKQLAHPVELTWAKTRTSKLFICKAFYVSVCVHLELGVFGVCVSFAHYKWESHFHRRLVVRCLFPLGRLERLTFWPISTVVILDCVYQK